MYKYLLYFCVFLCMIIVSGTTQKYTQIDNVRDKVTKIYRNQLGYWEAEFLYGIKMIYIPSGQFIMGSNFDQENEKPCHKVYLDGFWIGKTEITRGQFQIFIDKTNYITQAEKNGWSAAWFGKEKGKTKDANWKNPFFPQNSNHPVVCISWDDARCFCEWLSKEIKMKFHLPTEAQWEKAARGTDGRKYPWGNQEYTGKKANIADKNIEIGWADTKINDGFKTTAPVGSFPMGASPYGCFDMAGNVWEWCFDGYSDKYYMTSPKQNPRGIEIGIMGDQRVFKGGCWIYPVTHIRSAFRFHYVKKHSQDNLGFRIAATSE